MPKIEEARAFLEEVGMPKAQQADICCLTLLAMADLKPEDGWAKATNHWIRIHDVIAFANEHYATTYAENSRETFRKQAMHHLEQQPSLKITVRRQIVRITDIVLPRKFCPC